MRRLRPCSNSGIMDGAPLSVTLGGMSRISRALIAISSGLLLIVAEWRLCPVSFESVIYWSSPFFHLFFPGSPRADLCALILNSVIVTAGVFVLLSRKRKAQDDGSAPTT